MYFHRESMLQYLNLQSFKPILWKCVYNKLLNCFPYLILCTYILVLSFLAYLSREFNSSVTLSQCIIFFSTNNNFKYNYVVNFRHYITNPTIIIQLIKCLFYIIYTFCTIRIAHNILLSLFGQFILPYQKVQRN